MVWANHPDGIRIITHKKWIPPLSTIARLMEELKEKPFIRYRNKEIKRSVRIMIEDKVWHLWFRLYYSPTVKWFYLETHFVWNGLERTLPQILYGDDYRGAHHIIKEQIKGY